jgi:hypothetical protein
MSHPVAESAPYFSPQQTHPCLKKNKTHNTNPKHEKRVLWLGKVIELCEHFLLGAHNTQTISLALLDFLYQRE